MSNGETVIKNASLFLGLALPKAEPSNRDSSMYEGGKSNWGKEEECSLQIQNYSIKDN